MKATSVKDSAIDLLSVYTSDTGDISFGMVTEPAETKKRKAKTRTRERINARKFTWH